ncbi:thiosulfate sulfurtransferase/rhodanese-like domain-containing protein 3 isoform X3 [Saccopteryx leptura]|uniref:thiosulfate sulfurtransferase/rhodanese-like domain-containing protein 3 isoform X3 n=1 Tax=Saccopteryx leptura TaxID=249018 RepID=UPI00339C68E0
MDAQHQCIIYFTSICVMKKINQANHHGHISEKSDTSSKEAAGLNSIKGNCHNFCTAVFKDVTYKELKSLLKSKKIMLIDVRETWEILEHGKIPGSVNIPLDEVVEALQMNPENFKEKYNEVKPSKSDKLVFSCLAGVRSKKALDTAISLGFNSAQHYPGGWKEWATYEYSKKQGD